MTPRCSLSALDGGNQTNATDLMLMNPKILVVDDDHSVRESVRKLLATEGYETIPARDADEALDQFNAQQVDLVILDINLGMESGWEVFAAMTARNPFVPTIVITAEWGQRDKAVTLGVEGLIEKPIDVPVFLKMIQDLLAESTEAQLKRICGNETYCRYVGRNYETYLRMLQERYAAPLRIPQLRAGVPDTAPIPATAKPTVIAGEGDIFGRRKETGFN